GSRPLTDVWLQFRQDHALARDAVHSELSPEFLETFAGCRSFPVIQTLAGDRKEFVLFPPRGKRVSDATMEEIRSWCKLNCDVQIVVSDGLSAKAVEKNLPDLLPMLELGLEHE